MKSVEGQIVQVAVAQIKGYLYPTAEEQAAAYELLIELSTRTAGAHLASTDGSIRDELSSIDQMFGITRDILRRHGAKASKGSGGNLSLAVIAIRVLNEVFRPVVSRWDPILTDYEARRLVDDPNATAIEWERRWERASQCRSELNEMRASVRSYIDTLSRIAGASAIADAVLSAPNSVMFAPITLQSSTRPASVPESVQPRRQMVRWLDPIEMWQTWRSGFRAVASLELLEEQQFVAPEGPDAEFEADQGEDFWFDYIADLGDGFDGTAPIAWLAGRHRIDLPDDRFGDLPTPPKSMPRGKLLVLGGDEVYPFAASGRYEAQLELPFAMGLEDGPDGTAPTVIAIPGNHDWLGGIEHFASKFVAREQFAGHWRTVQSNNWWHVKLPQGWWLWGIDTALDNELIGTQKEYFEAAAASLRSGDRVILCTPVPLWQLRQKYRESYTALRGVLDPLIIGRGATLPLCLSGDSHFFAHLERLDTDFGEDHITAGGGGAFLQPTHNLPERIPLEEGNAEFKLTTRWPLPADSRAIGPGTRKVLFDRQYWPLMVLAGLLSLALAGLSAIRVGELWSTDDTPGARSWTDALSWTLASPWALALLLLVVCSGVIALRGNSVEPKLTSGARVYGLVIGSAVAATLVLVASTRCYVTRCYQDPPGTTGVGLWISLGIAALVSGVLAIVVFMAGVRWTNVRIKAADTLAFSPAYSTRFKHFLRFRIDKDGDLTCYAIGVDPVGEGWYEAMTTTLSVPPYDRAGIPRVHYVWGKTYRKFVPVPLDIAVSISETDAESAVALTEEFERVCGILIDGGHTLMYGGIPDVGYTSRLHEIEQRRHADNPNVEPHLVNYVADYLWSPENSTSVQSGARVIRVARVRAEAESDIDRPIRDLTEMRRHMTRRAELRLVIGGALIPPSGALTRSAPGVIEEAYLAVEAGRPLVVAGGFGGAARLIADAILGCADPAEIDALAGYFVPPMPRVDGLPSPDFSEMLDRLNSLGVLRNGLTDGENRELLRSRDPNTVSELIIRSVHRIGSHHAH